MGRTLLILIILLSVIFTGVALRMQNKMGSIPFLMRDHQIKREVENVSDYALRNGASYGISHFPTWLSSGIMTYHVEYDGGTTDTDDTDHQPLLTLGNSRIIRTTFTDIQNGLASAKCYVGEYSFKVATEVEGTLQGKTITKPAELAFNYYKVDNPTLFYYQMNDPDFESGARVEDTSGSGNHGYPKGGITFFSSPGDGVAGWKCGFWHNDYNEAFYAPDDSTMRKVNNFTLVCYAKIDKDSVNRNVALVWMPSAAPASGITLPPAMAIWYNGAGSTYDNCIRYSVGLTNGTWLSVNSPFSSKLTADDTSGSGTGYRSYSWMFFALTFADGVLKAYYNGLPLTPGVSYPNPVTGSCTKILESKYGVSIGSKIYSLNGSGNYSLNSYEYCLNGVMDQVGMFDHALTDAEVLTFYQDTMIPTRVDYIRD